VFPDAFKAPNNIGRVTTGRPDTPLVRLVGVNKSRLVRTTDGRGATVPQTTTQVLRFIYSVKYFMQVERFQNYWENCFQ